MAFESRLQQSSRLQIATVARGLISEAYPLGDASTTGVPSLTATQGTLTLSLLGLQAGDVVTNIVVAFVTLGSGLTFVKLGLFDKTGVFLRASAEVHTTFLTPSPTGLIPVPLSSPYTIPSDDGYYAAFLQYGSGATGATLIRSGASAPLGQALGSGARAAAAVSARTDIAANVTLADGTQGQFWLGVS